jgi:hypothetical protein
MTHSNDHCSEARHNLIRLANNVLFPMRCFMWGLNNALVAERLT